MAGRFRSRSRTLLAASLLGVGLAGAAAGALLGIVPDFPQLFYDSQGVTSYDADLDRLSIAARPLAIRRFLGDPPARISEGEIRIEVEVDAAGVLVGGVPGDDLLVTGSVTFDPSTSFSGTLVTGEVLEFGFRDTTTTSDSYDFRFALTGGLLASLWGSADVAVVVASEQSDFVGDFTLNFGGDAKGTLGSVPRVPVCGDGFLDEPEEECDPPGGQAQCAPGSVCNPQCQCEAVPLDAFKCYKTRQLDRPGFGPLDVSLEDAFTSTTASVRRPIRLCNPTRVNDEGPVDDSRHLMCYRIQEPKFSRREVIVENRFGEQHLLLHPPDQVCLPAEKDGQPPVAELDAFKCYRVRRTPGTPRFEEQTVTLQDQFETKQTQVLRPRLLCTPVERDGEGILDPSSDLTCYSIKDLPAQPQLESRDVSVLDAFGTLDLRVLRSSDSRRFQLCVPSRTRQP